jgi:hypothetical protein
VQKLHLVSFDVPFPADYGGVIDVYYKLKALKNAGVKVCLHAFQYGREPAPILEELCQEVHYYKRPTSSLHLLGRLPFIVDTRKSEALLKKLKEDDAPILLEGLHSCGWLPELAAAGNRKIVVRTHNVEHHYYEGLAQAERRWFKRQYLRLESEKLRRFEPVLKHASALAVISRPDAAHFIKTNPNTQVVSAFHAYDSITSEPGSGNYALYHGNLGVSENQEAALFLIQQVFNRLQHKLVIAGNNPCKELIEAARNQPNVELRQGVSNEQIMDWIKEAHLNILPSFQATGIKLKLLAALFSGRHCLVNKPMVEGTGLESYCHIAKDAADFRNQTNHIFTQNFDIKEIQNRRELENGLFSNRAGINTLMGMLRV